MGRWRIWKLTNLSRKFCTLIRVYFCSALHVKGAKRYIWSENLQKATDQTIAETAVKYLLQIQWEEQEWFGYNKGMGIVQKRTQFPVSEYHLSVGQEAAKEWQR